MASGYISPLGLLRMNRANALSVSAGRRLQSEICFEGRERGRFRPAPGRAPALPAFPRCDSIRNGFRLLSILPCGAAFHLAAPFLHIRSRMYGFCGLSASFRQLRGIPPAESERSLEGVSIYEVDHRPCRRTRRPYALHGGGIVVRLGVRSREGRAAHDRRIPRTVFGQGGPSGDHLGAHGLETRHRGEPREGALHARASVRQLRYLHRERRQAHAAGTPPDPVRRFRLGPFRRYRSRMALGGSRPRFRRTERKRP